MTCAYRFSLDSVEIFSKHIVSMPWKKTTRLVRRANKRAINRFRKRYTGARGMVNLYRDVSMLKTAVNSETKYHDKTSVISHDLTDLNPLLLVPFDGLAQGSGEQQRVGDQVKALYTRIRLHIELNTTSTTIANTGFLRVMVVMDKHSRFDSTLYSGSALAGIVLADTSTGVQQMISPYKTQVTQGAGSVGDRFKILRDFRVSIDNVKQKSRLIDVAINHKKYSPKKHGQIIRYDSFTEQACSPRMYVLVLTDNNVTSNLPIYAYTRFAYNDS